MKFGLLGLMMVLGLRAQEFEVASIKPAPPPTGNGIRVMMQGGPGSDDPGRLDWNNVSVQQMLTYAFNVKDYQLQGPDWLNSERFILTAKIPQGSTRDQVRLMLQKLLAERFKLAVHHESKDHAVYALVVKGTPKVKESDPNDTSGIGPPPGAREGLEAGRVGAGAPRVPPGRGGMMTMARGHLQAKRTSIEGLAAMLSNMVGKPVIDQTELKGIYDFTLDYAPDSVAGGPVMMGGGPPPPPPGAGGEVRGPVASEPSSALDIFAAVQQELGFKLEAKKLPLDNVIVDHIDRVPTEN